MRMKLVFILPLLMVPAEPGEGAAVEGTGAVPPAAGDAEGEGTARGKRADECEDTNSNCPTWAKNHCQGQFSDFMTQNCPKSCKFCGGESLYNTSSLQSMSGLDPVLKEKLMKNLETDLDKFTVYAEAEKKQRYIKPWVQSSPLTDRLGRNSRLLTTCVNSLQSSMGSQSRASTGPQATVDKFLSNLRSQCARGEDILSTNPVSMSATCDASSPADQFRSLDGRCNNLANTSWGGAGIPMRRLTQPSYADGVATPRDSPTLPNPREVSNTLHSTSGPGPLTSKGFTHMAMQFGQFLDHDITLTPQLELECCNAEFLKMDRAQPLALRHCLNIPVPDSDKDFFPLSCFSFTRSSAACTDSPASPREQLNGITAFVDGSNIYGSDDDTSTKLRELSDGKLKVHSGFSVENLPMRSQCPFPSPPGAPDDLVAGDVRVTIQPTLASMHTLFLNEHNRIVTGLLETDFLKHFKPFSSMSSVLRDDLLFKIARRLVGAELQQIVYSEYLPVVLGSAAMGNLAETSTTYRPTSDPSILNEFATVAFRFGHTTVSDIFEGRFDWKLEDHFHDQHGGIFVTGGFSPDPPGSNWRHEMTGASGQKAPAGDLAITDALRNKLFNSPDDLVARNLQRGREHGIPSYSNLRVACGMEPLSLDKPAEINQQRWTDLLAVYKVPSDIDAYTGGLAETAPSDGIVGPLFACIISRQFERLRDGDRYFYTHQEDSATSARPLKTVAKENILKRSLAAVMCDNIPTATLTDDIQRSVFRVSGQDNPKQFCTSLGRDDALDFEGIAREAMTEDLGVSELHSDSSFSYYKVKVDSGVTMVEGATVTACEKRGMKAICGGKSGCRFIDETKCQVTPLETDCEFPIAPTEKAICKNDEGKCTKMEGVFVSQKGWGGSDYGKVENKFVGGKHHTSGEDGKTLWAYCVMTMTPVDCEVSAWSSWGSCSRTCDKGTRTRIRTVTTERKGKGKECPSLSDSQSCNAEKCIVDCEVSVWSSWGTCSRACDGGTRTRTRTVTTERKGKGKECPSLSGSQSCNSQTCRVDCEVSGWSFWSGCSRACGGGTMTRTRIVTKHPKGNGNRCPGLFASQSCNTQPCFVAKPCIDPLPGRVCLNNACCQQQCQGRGYHITQTSFWSTLKPPMCCCGCGLTPCRGTNRGALDLSNLGQPTVVQFDGMNTSESGFAEELPTSPTGNSTDSWSPRNTSTNNP